MSVQLPQQGEDDLRSRHHDQDEQDATEHGLEPITRSDRGQGACETVYVDRFEIVREANPGWRRLFAISRWLAPLSLIGFVTLLLITPVRRSVLR